MGARGYGRSAYRAGMESITIKPCTVEDVQNAHNVADLLAEYANESALDALGVANPQWETYRQMQAMGVAHVLGAYKGDALVGFLVLLVSVVPHFGKPIASTESYFVARCARKSGAGLMLLHVAEQVARQAGAIALFVSAPIGSRLARVLPGVGFRDVQHNFFKGLEDGH